MRGQLHALRLAARKRRRRLPQPQITEPDLIQHRQLFQQLGLPGKEAQRLLHRHLQHVVNVLALVLHVENLCLVARAVAVLAGQLHVGQELHLHRHRAVALAGVAAPARHVERKMPRREREPLGLGLRGKQLAHQIESLDVGDGIRARRATDRRLIHQHHVVQPLHAAQRSENPGGIAAIGLAQRPRHRAIQHLVHQRGFARSGDAGDRNQHPQRNLHVQSVQIVGSRPAQHQLFAARRAPPRGHGNRNLPAQDSVPSATPDWPRSPRARPRPAACRRTRPRPAPDRANDRPRAECRRRAPPPESCFPGRAALQECESAAPCRACAIRSTARPARRARPPAAIPAKSPVECAAPRRPRASTPAGRASGIPAPPRPESPAAAAPLQNRPGNLLLHRRKLQRVEKLLRLRNGQRRRLANVLVPRFHLRCAPPALRPAAAARGNPGTPRSRDTCSASRARAACISCAPSARKSPSRPQIRLCRAAPSRAPLRASRATARPAARPAPPRACAAR